MPATKITFNTANAKHRLIDLITGADTSNVTVGKTYPNAHPCCKKLTVTADPGNAAGKVLVGDGSLAAGSFGASLGAGAAYDYGDPVMNNIALTNKFIQVDTIGGAVNISWEYA